MKFLRIALPLLGLILLSLIFWYAVVPGVILGFVFGGRWERIVTLISSALLIFASRFLTSGWIPSFDLSFGTGVVAEFFSFALGWLWCGFLFFSGYRVERNIRLGYQSAKRTEQQGEDAGSNNAPNWV